jgi:hypothetical protein
MPPRVALVDCAACSTVWPTLTGGARVAARGRAARAAATGVDPDGDAAVMRAGARVVLREAIAAVAAARESPVASHQPRKVAQGVAFALT